MASPSEKISSDIGLWMIKYVTAYTFIHRLRNFSLHYCLYIMQGREVKWGVSLRRITRMVVSFQYSFSFPLTTEQQQTLSFCTFHWAFPFFFSLKLLDDLKLYIKFIFSLYYFFTGGCNVTVGTSSPSWCLRRSVLFIICMLCIII